MCDYRVCRCGVNSSACKRQLRSWFKGDVANGQGKLVRCDKHGETVSRAEGRGGGERERERRGERNREKGERRREKGRKRRGEKRRTYSASRYVVLCECGV